MAKPPAKRLAKSSKRSGKEQELSSPVSKTLLISAGLFFAVIFSAFVIFTNNRPTSPALIGGPFQMTTHLGTPINEQDLMGKPFLVFFGYTHCPDVCHTTLFEMSEILRALGPNAKINALFVTVDPERDSAEVLKDYLSNFDSRIIGVTGPRSQLEPMLREYRIYAKRAPGNNIDYAVDHTTVVYLMDKNGHFVTPFNVSRRPYDAAHEIEKYL
ncbi:MAG: SCO family protein [Methylocystis sp.]|jgi:protein SCO1/2